MAKFNEKITIEESLIIRIRDKKTGKVTTKWIKKPWSMMSKWEKFLHLIGIKKYPGSIQPYGEEQAAKLYGNVTPCYYIDRISARHSGTTWVPKTSQNSYEATGKLKVKNENSPWSGGYDYGVLKCYSNSDSGNYHNWITISLDLGNAPDIEWWAEITFTFSG